MDSIGSKPAEPQGVSRKLCLACNREFLDAGISHCPHDKTQLVNLGRDEIQDWIGKTINGKYKLLEAVGKGGMGTVYKAEQLTLGRIVAVKMLKAQLSEDKVSVKRFEQEATASAALQHPNLIMIHDHGMIDDKQPYIVMEFLEGESLSSIIRELGSINPVRCLRIFSQVMTGLKAAHDKGVLHRDIKPSNILLCRSDNPEEKDKVKVVDFGLAKLMPWSGKESQHLTKTGEVFGSPIYMSPEQCQGKKLEQSSDIYSVGVTLYEALTGKPPFKGRNVVETASMHIGTQPTAFELIRPDLRLSNKLQAVIFKALDKDPVRRFLSMDEFKQALTEAISGPDANQGFRADDELADIPVAATQPVKKTDLENYKAPKMTARQAEQQQEENRRRSGILASIISIVILLAAGGGYWWFTSQKPAGSSTGTTVPMRAEVTGQVYYLNLSPIGKPGEVRKGYTVNEVHIMPSDGEPLVKLKANFKQGGVVDNLRIGETWTCKTTEPVKEVTFKEAPNKIIYAYNSLFSFLEALDQNDDQWKKYVDTLANSDAFSGLQKEFKNYKLKITPISESKFDMVTKDAYTNRPLPQCVKVIEADDESVVFILDKRMIYNMDNKEIDHPLYQKFALNSRGNEWHIGRIVPETQDPAEWDKY